LPLDRFVADHVEVPVLLAAQVILFSQCVSPDGLPAPAAVAYALNMLRTPYFIWSPDRLFGYWDAPLVARNGGVREKDIDVFFAMGVKDLDADEAVKESCRSNASVVGLYPVEISYYYYDDIAMRSTTEFITSLRIQSYSLMLESGGFASALAEFATCAANSGYMVLQDNAGAPRATELEYQPGWTEEQSLQAIVVEASCNDELSITQRLGDIQATFEATLVRDHEAELVAIRAEVDARLERAHAILREVGLE
jgi:hypothetical protein